tara:strand:- start:468 stop:620 length:153 start_codon:yes stop_codon:yes gene_type:complete
MSGGGAESQEKGKYRGTKFLRKTNDPESILFFRASFLGAVEAQEKKRLLL